MRRRALSYAGVISPDYARAVVSHFASLPLTFLLQRNRGELAFAMRSPDYRIEGFSTYRSCASMAEELLLADDHAGVQRAYELMDLLLSPLRDFDAACRVYSQGGVAKTPREKKLRNKLVRPSDRKFDYWNLNEQTLCLDGPESHVRRFFVLAAMSKEEFFEACRSLAISDEARTELWQLEDAVDFSGYCDMISLFNHACAFQGEARYAELYRAFIRPFILIEA